MKRIIVAIDGFSSCGKSTIAKQLAQYAGYTYVDTGAMYRAVALYLRDKVDFSFEGLLTDEQNTQIGELCEPYLAEIRLKFVLHADGQHIYLNDKDVEREIRTLEIGNLASKVSLIRRVRSFLVEQQQLMGSDKGIVMDGRDIGTVVFPQAELKLFLTASPEARAKRRFCELQAKGEHPIFEDVLRDVNERDYRDTHRAESPMRQTEDAVVIDNSQMSKEEQMEQIIEIFNQYIQ